MVVHILSIVFTGFMVWLSSPGSDLFSWHPTAMTVAFVLLLLQAIIIFSPESSLFPDIPKSEKIQLHWILHAFGVFSAVLGFGAVYLNKEVHGRKHFTSWHGKFGLATVIGSLLALCGGLAAKYSLSFKAWARPINIKMWHATAGMIVYLLAMTSLAIAMYSNWYKNRVTGWAWRISFWVPIVLAICIARQVTQSYLPKVLTPRESKLDSKAREIQEKVDAKLRKRKTKKTVSDNNESTDDAIEEIKD